MARRVDQLFLRSPLAWRAKRRCGAPPWQAGTRFDDRRSRVCVLPDFRYRAVAADGTVENEICPVFCAHADDSVRPAPDEVMDYRWVPWRDVRQAAGLPWVISPWAVEQIPLLDASTYMDHGPSSSASSATQMH